MFLLNVVFNVEQLDLNLLDENGFTNIHIGLCTIPHSLSKQHNS